jgi:hypothetical protein
MTPREFVENHTAEYNLDPATIILIIGIIVDIARCLYEYNWTHDNIMGVCKNPTSTSRSLLYVIARKRMGRKLFSRLGGKKFVDTLLFSCMTIPKKELEEMLTQARSVVE